MAVGRRPSRSSRPARTGAAARFTVDASVFVNAFNLREAGHAASLRILSAIQDRAVPMIVPTLIIPEIAAAVARATGDHEAALDYAAAAAALPHLTLVSLTAAVARQAGELAAVHRLRGADAVYVAVARRYGTTIVSRDRERNAAGSSGG